MTWTGTTRPNYERAGLMYASDTTDAEWALLDPLMPEPAGIGRPRTTDLRAVVNAIRYILPVACAAEELSAALDRTALLLSLAR